MDNRKSDKIYSARHRRRLLKRQNDSDLERLFGESSNPIYNSALGVQAKNVPESPLNIEARNVNVVTSDNEMNVDMRLHCTDQNDQYVVDDHDTASVCSSTHSFEYPDYNSSDDETESLEPELTEDDFKEDVANFMIEAKLTREANTKLLSILNKHTNCRFPKTPSAFLKTPRNTNVIQLCQGSYWHNGLHEVILNILGKRKALGLLLNNRFNLFINIDGAPLGKSTSKSLWPILCSDDIVKDVDVIGIYYGESKPTDVNKFLELFINESVELINTGIIFDNITYVIRIKGLICDVPAKAYILMVAGHNGYNSCTKCYVGGEYVENTVCFPGVDHAERTDVGFKNFEYDLDYQHGKTDLQKIPYLGLVSNVPLDYMHLICLGVTRKLIQLWLSGPINKNVRLSSNNRDKLSASLLNIVKSMPDDFSRKPRALKYLKHWKATELRTFLLYTGPVVLRHILREDLYNHFIKFHIAVTILCSPVLSSDVEKNNFAGQLLKRFVNDVEHLYGKKYISHNVHNLIHVAKDVRTFGCALDEYSAFRFENFIGILLRLIRKGEKPLEQIHRRMKEYRLVTKISEKEIKEIKLVKRHYSGILTRETHNSKQYTTLYKDKYIISCKDNKNNCALLDDGTVVEVLNFALVNDSNSFIIGHKLRILGENLYSHPISSSVLSINKVKKDHGPVRKLLQNYSKYLLRKRITNILFLQ